MTSSSKNILRQLYRDIQAKKINEMYSEEDRRGDWRPTDVVSPSEGDLESVKISRSVSRSRSRSVRSERKNRSRSRSVRRGRRNSR